VDRSVYPTALELSKDEAELMDPNAYPIKVHLSPSRKLLNYILLSLTDMLDDTESFGQDRHRIGSCQICCRSGW
jgi:hypothetical protein